MKYEDFFFSRAEFEVLLKLMEGKGNGQIANELFIAVGTVKYHINNIVKKAGIKSVNGQRTSRALLIKFANTDLSSIAPPATKEEYRVRVKASAEEAVRRRDEKLDQIDKRVSKLEDIVIKRRIINE